MNYDFSNIPVDLILNILNIVILFVIVRFIVYKPVKKFVDARKERAHNLTTEAASKLMKAKETEAEYNQKLADAAAEAERISENAAAEAKRRAEKILADAQSEADRIIEEARHEAEKEKSEILESVKPEIASMSAMMAEKILERSVSDEDTRRIAEEFFASAR